MKVQRASSAAVISHIVSLHRWKEFLGGDLLELRMRVEEGHVVIQCLERVFLYVGFQYFQFECNIQIYPNSFMSR